MLIPNHLSHGRNYQVMGLGMENYWPYLESTVSFLEKVM